jgi:hypothetical protein
MADTSSYSIEERLVASVWVREKQHTGQTLSQVMAAFRERFNKSPPQRATLLDWKKNELSLLEVLKRARGVGERQRAWKTQLNSVAAANHVCTILDTVAKLPFYIILRAVLCKFKLSLRCILSGCTVTSRPPCIGGWLAPRAGLDGCGKSHLHRDSIP